MEPDEEHPFRHFSHEHPLECTILPPTGNNTTCYGCNLNILPGRDYYKCKFCPFFLHQVCYNMPRSTQHPSDPTHNLLLLATPSAQSTFECKACTQPVTGFYYFCSQCGDHYHILCSIMPLLVKIPSHFHSVKLEFSPPYEFQCDLCNKPGYSGWLYRCGSCDYDVHLACAILNQRAQLLQNQATPNNGNIRSSSTGNSESHRATPDIRGKSSYPGKESQPSTPFSEDLTLSSYQFSDAYFSIELAMSYTGNNDHINHASNEVTPSRINGFSHFCEAKNGKNYIMANASNEPNHHQKVPEYRQNGVILTGPHASIWDELGQEKRTSKGIGSRSISEISLLRTSQDQTCKSDSVSQGCFCCLKLFFCCKQ